MREQVVQKLASDDGLTYGYVFEKHQGYLALWRDGHEKEVYHSVGEDYFTAVRALEEGINYYEREQRQRFIKDEEYYAGYED